MVVCYTIMGKVLWGSKSIGEHTQRQIESIKSKKKVCALCSRNYSILNIKKKNQRKLWKRFYLIFFFYLFIRFFSHTDLPIWSIPLSMRFHSLTSLNKKRDGKKRSSCHYIMKRVGTVEEIECVKSHLCILVCVFVCVFFFLISSSAINSLFIFSFSFLFCFYFSCFF